MQCIIFFFMVGLVDGGGCIYVSVGMYLCGSAK